MHFNKHVFMALLVAAYAVTFAATFGVLYDSVQISSIALVGLFAWLYGVRAGFLSIAGFILLNTAILTLVSGKTSDILLTYNPLGIILAMIAAWATGSLRDAQTQLDEARASLSKRVAEATAELDELACKLIENDERERTQIGQDLHDGVGQYLTGMLLHSESLALDLRKTGRVEADLAEWMTRRIQKNIQIVRQLSRSLLPIEFTEMNLETALGEMISYFDHASTASIELEATGDSTTIPPPIAQHLYRIAYEAADRLIHQYKASIVTIQLITENASCRLKIEGCKPLRKIGPSKKLVSRIMEYRLRAINAKEISSRLPRGGFRLECWVDFDREDGK